VLFVRAAEHDRQRAARAHTPAVRLGDGALADQTQVGTGMGVAREHGAGRVDPLRQEQPSRLPAALRPTVEVPRRERAHAQDATPATLVSRTRPLLTPRAA